MSEHSHEEHDHDHGHDHDHLHADGTRHSHTHGHARHSHSMATHHYDMPDLPTQVDIFDTILRDGSQQEGLSLTVDDKIRVSVWRISREVGPVRTLRILSSSSASKTS